MDDLRIIIRDWDIHFEADRSRQWKKLSWVPVPNKQGLGYKKIMLQKNGVEIFGCWIAIIEQGSLCTPRGDLSKYSLSDLSTITMIPIEILKKAINFILQNLDWIEVIENLDKNVNDLDKDVSYPHVVSSLLCNSILSSSNTSKSSTSNNIDKFKPPSFDDFKKYCDDNGFENIAERAFRGYEEADWHDSKGKKIKNWKQKLQHVWFSDKNRDKNSNRKKDTQYQENEPPPILKLD